MCPVIRISDELFTRLESYAIGFDTPSSVIERLLDEHENIDENSIDKTDSSKSKSETSTRTNPKPFLSNNFPDLLHYKRSTSRMYESKEKKIYHDCWWFNFGLDSLKSNEFIVFAGALDYENKNFRVFKVPTSYLLLNIDKIDMTKNGWINLYIHMEELVDIRKTGDINNLSFRDFTIN
jgi:hypothetical protein